MPIATIPRGGANTSDHVDILGSMGLNEIILKVATGAGDEIEDQGCFEDSGVCAEDTMGLKSILEIIMHYI
jgi:hypothetical protein